MNWKTAMSLIENTIQVGLDVNTNRSTYRKVLAIPPYQCKKYTYNNTPGYKVSIGGNNVVEIPLTMLQQIFNAAVENDGVYNNDVFKKLFPKQAKDHGCHIHVVGRMFEVAGVATKKDNQYHII